MKHLTALALACVLVFNGIAFACSKAPPAPNGIKMPSQYKDWRVISVSHREDNKTLRVILGNNKAIMAARNGKTVPWPNGSILAKLVWKDASNPKWDKAKVPGEFVHAEFMIKDSEKYRETGGWGFARWTGASHKPYGKDPSFVQECFGCHAPVKDNDHVFTHPAFLP